MVVVRESPNAKIPPDKNNIQWPPRSPLDALLSSPSGRQKWRDMKDRRVERSLSPSPLKKALGSSRALQEMAMSEDDDEDEDEEMVQLRLQALQAKIKLKKLQKKAKVNSQNSEHDERVEARATSPRRPPRPPISQPPLRRPDVEVPVSPTKDRLTMAHDQPSPAARRLGVRKMTNVEDVSLKRARDGTQVKRAHSVRSSKLARTEPMLPKPQSFSERIATSRTDARDQQEKQDRIEKSRRKGFASNGTAFSRASTLIQRSSSPHQPGDELPKRAASVREPACPSSTNEQASMTRTSSVRSTRLVANELAKTSMAPGSTKVSRNSPERLEGRAKDLPPGTSKDGSSPSSYDPFSEIHLSKRHIPHVDVARAMEDSEIYTLPRLLKEVKAPHYETPECEGNFVIFAIVAEKSTPFNQKATARTSDEHKPQEDADAPRNKFMVLKLCDLKWEVDCFLFGTAFDQFWKLTPGTLLAILNPSILPPKTNQHSGRFSLKLGSSDDCVMEIGMARDLAYCASIKKDGRKCGSWIDKRSTEICDFHVTLLVDKQRKQRMEVNSNWGGAGDSQFRIKNRGREESGWDNQTNKKKNRGPCHGEYGRLYSVPTGLGKSAASLLDAEDTDKLHDMTREEASRKRIANSQKERDLAKKLSAMGGPGAEYLHKAIFPDEPSAFRSKDMTASDAKARYEKPTIEELGFKTGSTGDVHLSPGKDRKKHFGVGAISTSGRHAMGWGGAKTWGLLQPKENKKMGSPEKGQIKLKGGLVRPREEGSLSPSKKRARFALEKGIREPGRESLPGEGVAKRASTDDDDDDDLDIV